jgi:predicted TIM-barrel fold metal-dependent hydrolase
VIELLLSGVFDRFPTLQLYFAETQAGWLPHVMNWLDEYYQRWYHYYDTRLPRLPSEYIREHLFFSFIDDRLAMPLRRFIGLDHLMWGSDFPHSVGTFPHSTEILEDLFEDVPAAERRRVLVENPCRFFGLDPNQELTPTPSLADAL